MADILGRALSRVREEFVRAAIVAGFIGVEWKRSRELERDVVVE